MRLFFLCRILMLNPLAGILRGNDESLDTTASVLRAFRKHVRLPGARVSLRAEVVPGDLAGKKTGDETAASQRN